MLDHKLAGKVVIIGGGAKNLGGLIARQLAGGGSRGWSGRRGGPWRGRGGDRGPGGPRRREGPTAVGPPVVR